MPKTDTELLRDFEKEGDEHAFQELVKRYLGLIYHAALRRSGNPQLAEEAAQNVLSLLVKKAANIANEPSRLPAWLHRAATLEAANLLRAEKRHQKRRETMTEQAIAEDSLPDPWQEALPHLDASLLCLSEGDRQLVVMHYLQRMSHRDIAVVVGKSESAVQRQCHRCLKKLADLLRTRGVVLTSTAFATLLSAEAAKAVPISLVSKLSAAALLAPGVSSLPFITKSMLLMNAAQKVVLACAIVTTGTAISYGLYQASKPVPPVLTPAEQEVHDNDLFQAAFQGNAAAVERLLKAGANPNAWKDDLSGNIGSEIKRQESLLKEVLHRGRFATGRTQVRGDQVIAITKLLLEHGADPDATNELEGTPITFACGGYFGSVEDGISAQTPEINTELTQLLLDAGADPDKAGRYGGRAIEIAVDWGNAALVAMLIKAGADLDFEPWNKSSDTLLGFAIDLENRRPDGAAVLELLRNAGAK